jgi:hypothetical protein
LNEWAARLVEDGEVLMLRIQLPVVLATIALLAFASTAQAEVIVVPKSSGSSPVVVKTAPSNSTVIVVKDTPKPAPPPEKPKERERKIGLHFDVAGTFGPQVSMGGFNAALRFRPKPFFGLDLGSGYFGGDDYRGFYRTEIPLTANMLFFLNPQHKFQFYFLLGPGAAFGTVRLPNENRDMIHIGGQGGFGVEWRLAKAFALNTDARAVIRHRVDRDPRPEFVEGTRTSNTSVGGLFSFGMTFYF